MMNNSQMRSAVSIIKRLIRATESEKSYIVEHLSGEEIKSLCSVVKNLPRGVKRKPNEASLVKKYGAILGKLKRAKNKKDYKKVGAGISRVGGGIFTSLLVALLGGVLAGELTKK